MKRALPIALSVCAVMSSVVPAQAQAADRAPNDENAPRISIVTMGPGDHPFLKFGHNAIWVEDHEIGVSRLYNFGTFAFTSPSLITDFLQGRLKYWLSIQNPRALDEYRAANRSLVVQQLNLTPAERRSIAARLRENALPENRAYKYDYYLDNCATRVRDVIDKAIAGRLHEATRGPASMSFRHHTLRLVADDVPLYVVLHLALGPAADRPITKWDEMFLPGKIQQYVRGVTRPEGAAQVPLVARETTLFAAKREPVRSEPPQRVPWAVSFGIALGALMAILGQSTRRAARHVFGLGVAGLGLIAGFLGSVFVFFWAFTDHEIAHKNENILQCAPFVLLLVVSGILSGASTGTKQARARKATFWLSAAALLCSTLGLVLKILPSFVQDNSLVIAFALPLWLGLSLGAYGRVPKT